MLSDDWLKQGCTPTGPLCLKQNKQGGLVQLKRWFDQEVLQGVSFSFLYPEDVHIEMDGTGWRMLQKALDVEREDTLDERLVDFFERVEGQFGEYLAFSKLLVSQGIPFQKMSFVSWD